ncbi:hypothetical protein GAMM_170098 [Gammaproteobacteria bacterium]
MQRQNDMLRTGLISGEYFSGDKKRLSFINRQGKTVLRKILIGAAWVTMWDTH